MVAVSGRTGPPCCGVRRKKGRDKGHHTVVYPGSLNAKWKIRMVRFIDEPLDKLDIGFAPDGTGKQIVGIRRSFVNRKFVDAFAGCMRDPYKTRWEGMYVWVLGPTSSGSAPIFLVGEHLTVSISHYLFGDQRLEPTGRYRYMPPDIAIN